ncbi:MAG: TlpA disulfide reductase family protein [Candidatus Limnocylindrales bacterium]
MTEPADRPRSRAGLIGPFSARQIGVFLVSLLVAGALLAFVTAPITPPGTPPPSPGATFFIIGTPTEGLIPGELAPELEGKVDGVTVGLHDLDGRPIRLADVRGRPVWLTFFATWCPPCQQETPVLRQAYEAHRDQGLKLIAVSVQETTPDDVRAYAETYGLTYDIGFDATSAVFRAYQAYGLPTHLFIDREGVIRNVWRGPLTTAMAEQLLAPLLTDQPASPSTTPTP